MPAYIEKQHSSRIQRSLATSIATAQVNTSTVLSTRFKTSTYQIRMASTLALWYSVGDSTNVTATAGTDTMLPANVIDYITVSPGQWLAFISTSTSSGYLSISEMT